MNLKALFLLLPFYLFSLPKSPDLNPKEVELNFSRLHDMEVVTKKKQMVIEWDSFSIAEHEKLRFSQPSRDSAVLNRIMGSEISNLLGSLSSNGKVYILNQNGILIGPDALIDVNALVASTLQLTNKDFFQGKEHFVEEKSADVINFGTIRAQSGDVHLIGRSVRNAGEIEALEGSACLTAAKEVWLKSEGKKRVLIRKDVMPDQTQGPGVLNEGVIHALEAELLADGNLYRLAINHTGSIDASCIQERSGRFFLEAEGGGVHLSGDLLAPGGEVEVLGKEIEINDGARVDVSSSLDGGVIHIGGGWRGEGTAFCADKTVLAKRASLRADGGKGGEVVLWGNSLAHVMGTISACGGAFSGDGGQIEISRMPQIESLALFTDAPCGKTGRLLIDPPDITISRAPSSSGVTEGAGIYAFQGNQTPLNINVQQITSLLGHNHVIIDATAGSSTAEGSGNITFGNLNGSDKPLLSWSSNNSLTLRASPMGMIEINEGINATGVADIYLQAQTINIGQVDHSQKNAVSLVTNGSLKVGFSGSGGSLGIYSGIGKEARVQTTQGVTVDRASGFQGIPGDLIIQSGGGSNPQNAALICEMGPTALTVKDLTIYSNGLDALIDSQMSDITINALGDIRVETTGSSRQAYISADWGVLSVNESKSMTITNTCSVAPTTKYAHGAYLICNQGGSFKSSGPIEVSSKNRGDFAYISSSDGPITISGCESLSIDNSSALSTYVSISSTSMSPSNIYSSGPILISVADGSNSACLESDSSLSVTSGGDMSVINSNKNNQGSAYIAGTSDLTIGAKGTIEVSAVSGVTNAYIASTAFGAPFVITECSDLKTSGGFVGSQPVTKNIKGKKKKRTWRSKRFRGRL